RASPPFPTRRSSDLVVGYDGSTESQRALRWAVEEARRRWTSLVICHAWHWPYPARPSDPALLETFEVLARGVLDQGVQIATGLRSEEHTSELQSREN